MASSATARGSHKTSGTSRGGSGARVGAGTRIRGRISGSGDLSIDGDVEGSIAVSGDLTVGEHGSVRGDAVEADSITVAGTLEADGQVTGQLRVLVGSHVRCNVKGGITIDEGAEFAGRIDADFDLPPELEGHSPARRGRN
jgi:cytoskeletal protein CcmA (bactofilin family)